MFVGGFVLVLVFGVVGYELVYCVDLCWLFV